VSVYALFLAKELRDLRRTPQLLAVFLIMPVTSVFMMALFAFMTPAMMQHEANDPVVQMLVQRALSLPEFSGLPPDAAYTALSLRAMLGFFLLMPVIISSSMAAYSVVGEKQQRTLEPLLATPITDRQLMLGKMLAALTPAVLVTWLAGAVAAGIAGGMTWTRWHEWIVPDRYWFMTLFVLAPLIGAGSVLATMRLSARSTDPQSAMQTSALLIMPAFLLLVAAAGKMLLVSITAGIIVAAAFVLIDTLLLAYNVRKFGREEILTRWR
jgi:ABC-2 type transport system permease protein